jgi:putative endonuclease
MRERARVGRYGENVACDLHKGFELVDRNWRCRHGELDIVAVDGRCVVAVEVKTRRSVSFGAPVESITRAKARRLRLLTAAWLSAHDVHAEVVRIDLIAVYLPPHGRTRVQHLRSVA